MLPNLVQFISSTSNPQRFLFLIYLDLIFAGDGVYSQPPGCDFVKNAAGGDSI
jgi:hypothetical protein